MSNRRTRLSDKPGEGAPNFSERPRLVFGQDIPCKTCKGSGERYDKDKDKKYPCYGCNGTGIRRKEE